METKEKSKSKKKPNSTSASISIEEKVNDSTEETLQENISENEPQKDTKQKKKPLRISSILTMVGVVTLGVISGAAIGLWLKRMNEVPEQSSVDPETLKEIEKEKKAVADKWEKAKKQNEDFYTYFEPIEMVQIALMRLENEDYLAESFGITNASGMSKQNITSIKAHFQDKYYYENISFGKIPMSSLSIAGRFYGTKDEITCYRRGKLNEEGTEQITGEGVRVYSATYKEENEKTLSGQEFIDTYGNPITSPIDYIVSVSTVNEEKEILKEKNDDGQISISFSLNDEATTNYKKKIVATSEGNVKNVTGFSYVNITCTLSSELQMIDFHVNEKYGTNLVPCTAFLHSYYFYDDISIDKLPTTPTEKYELRSEVK